MAGKCKHHNEVKKMVAAGAWRCRGASWLGPFVTMIYQMCRTDCVQFLVIYVVFMSGFIQGLCQPCCYRNSAAFSFGFSHGHLSCRVSVIAANGSTWQALIFAEIFRQNKQISLRISAVERTYGSVKGRSGSQISPDSVMYTKLTRRPGYKCNAEYKISCK